MYRNLDASDRVDADGLVTVGSPVSYWSVRASKQVTYEVRVSDDLLDPANNAILESMSAATPLRRLVVTDTTVHRLYGDRIRRYFHHHDVDFRLLVLPHGESHKTMDAVLAVVEALDEFGVDRRREPMIGIGGGVLLDIVGLAASLYRRALPYVRIPTTLIGLVDAGVGAKTGVNHNGHKNRLGTYYPAERTLLDRTFLRTLDRRHVSNGLAEILKIGLIKDARLFELLATHGRHLLATRLQPMTHRDGEPVPPLDTVPVSARLSRQDPDPDPATDVLERAIHGMLEELQPNLWEQVLERVVDYGHTFSPTIEMRALPELLHGEAVAIDMALTTVLATRRGLVSRAQCDRILATMTALGLPIWHPLCTAPVLAHALQDTVRHRDGQQRLPLPVGIGAAVFVNDVREDEIAASAAELANRQQLAVAR
ncbi:sedoheptulose 7-phosphate cyclase [Solwaraspora sp. WMMD791]|uniref:sedoheptulose 7-phosphate cyclase n=1 Tax=Solwaraspora sp. WMMD791 TaxID=3016086 RepID=UPI00249CC3EA|nr:sedoheptulose 7-phosphate cyclase [Solwaraspora sp. WMMD791]WFE28331.1 sedoheptulose 7-phosphate cyclase [Solwaraspora sp. WMMD791]